MAVQTIHPVQPRRTAAARLVITRLVINCVIALLVLIPPVHAETASKAGGTAPDQAAVEMVKLLYVLHKTLIVGGMATGATGPAATTFFSPELVATMRERRLPFDPLTGQSGAAIGQVDVEAGPDNGDPATTQVVANVQAGETVNAINLTVRHQEPRRIVALSGAGWALSESGQASEPEQAVQDTTRPTDDKPEPVKRQGGVGIGFVDDFAGSGLSAHWTVLNEDPDSYVVDNGELYVLTTGGTARFQNAEAGNIFQLNNPLPDTDFSLVLDAKLEQKTGFEGVTLGLRESADDYVAARLYTFTKGCGTALYLEIANSRPPEGEGKPLVTRFVTSLFDGIFAKNICTDGRKKADAVLERLPEEGFTLTFNRRGYLYSAEVVLNGPPANETGEPLRSETKAVSRFHPPGKAAILLSQSSKAKQGESVAHLQRFEIATPAQRPR